MESKEVKGKGKNNQVEKKQNKETNKKKFRRYKQGETVY
jgi:hypothetical protein